MYTRNISRLWLYCCSSLCAIALVLGGFSANAAVMPNTQLPTGSDSVSTPDGFRCSQGIAPDAYVEVGAYTDNMTNEYNDGQGGFVKVIIPLFKDRQRINCNKLYNMELRYRAEDRKLDQLAEQVFTGG